MAGARGTLIASFCGVKTGEGLLGSSYSGRVERQGRDMDGRAASTLGFHGECEEERVRKYDDTANQSFLDARKSERHVSTGLIQRPRVTINVDARKEQAARSSHDRFTASWIQGDQLGSRIVVRWSSGI